jgi:hypothetical protein
MHTPIDESASAAAPLRVVGGRTASVGPRGSLLERRIADGTYTADAHALARSFLEYLEHLAGLAEDLKPGRS